MERTVVGRWAVCGLLAVLPARAEQNADSAPVVVHFESSAKELPQSEIVEALRSELDRPVRTEPAPQSDVLVVSVGDDGQLKLRFRSASPELERSLPMPDDPHQLATLVSLAAANMIRDQSRGLVAPAPARSERTSDQVQPPPKPAPSARSIPPSRAKPTATPSPKTASYAKNRFGVQWAADWVFFGAQSNLCNPNDRHSGDFVCYVDDEPYDVLVYNADRTAVIGEVPFHPSVQGGAASGTKRVLLSYERIVTPEWRVGGRVGIAYDGPQDEFLPWHLEVRGTRILVPVDRQSLLRPYLFAAGGMAQAAGLFRPSVLVPTDESGSTRDATADVYRLAGHWFVAGGAGLELTPYAGVALDVGLPVMLVFPSTAVVLEPTVGIVATL